MKFIPRHVRQFTIIISEEEAKEIYNELSDEEVMDELITTGIVNKIRKEIGIQLGEEE